MSTQEILARWPRLIKALQWTAILSTHEAASAIRAHRDHGGNAMCACEAVAHWCAGNPVSTLLARAFKVRHMVAR